MLHAFSRGLRGALLSLVGLFSTASIASPIPPTLFGDSVIAQLTFYSSSGYYTQFVSPAVVGPGIEFTGYVTDAFRQDWVVSIDIGDRDLSVNIFSPSFPSGNLGASSNTYPLLFISLSDLDFSGGAVIDNVSYVSDVCTNPHCGPISALTSLAFTAHSIDMMFSRLLSTDVHSLTITTCDGFPGGGSTEGCFPGPGPFPVPEPGFLALLSFSLAGLAFTRRRKQAIELTTAGARFDTSMRK